MHAYANKQQATHGVAITILYYAIMQLNMTVTVTHNKITFWWLH